MAAPIGSSSGPPKEKTQISAEFQEGLKNFIRKGTSASWKERHEILRELNRLWSTEATGISEGPLRAILQNVGFCLPRYQGDLFSCRELLRFVQQVLDKAEPASYCHFFSLLTGIADSLVDSQSSSYSKCVSRLSLKISIFLQPKLNVGSPEWKNLIDVQSKLLYVATNTIKRAEDFMIYKIMRDAFPEDITYLEALVVYLIREDAPVYSIGYLKSLVVAMEQNKGTDQSNSLQRTLAVSVAKYYVRLTFSSKTAAPTQFLAMSQTVLRILDLDTLKTHILSPLVKAMLRNPELVLPATITILRAVKIDMSPFCLEIGKQLATQLHSKVEIPRKLSADAFRSLAEQCSDSSAVEELVRYLFAVLNGSEGKIALAAERSSMLTGIGNLSFQPGNITSSTADFVTSQFISAIGSEAHESCSVHAINMLSLWCEKFQVVPSSLLAAFKSIPTLKTPAIRVAYLTCMNSAFKEASKPQAMELVPLLTKFVETAISKPNDIQLASEALPAACLLMDLYSSSSQTDPKQQSLWNALFDMNKQIFASEKFLQSITDGGHKLLVRLVEQLLVFSYDQLKPDVVRMCVRVFSYALLRASRLSRENAFTSWKRIISVQQIGFLSEQLVDSLKCNLVKLKAVPQEKSDGEATKEVNYSKTAIVVLIKIVEFYVELNFSAADKGALIIECLLLAHEPGIAALQPGMWISLLRRFQHDCIFPDKLVSDYVDVVWEKSRDEETLPENAVKRAIETAVAFPTPNTIAKFLANIKLALLKPENLSVSLEDFLVFNTPAGVLYDKSVLDITAEGDSAKGNIKRESKAYSYKDQLAEEELRQELEAKKRAKSGGKEAQLTPKQKENMTKQLEKEKIVRQKVQETFRKIRRPFLILDSLITGNPTCLRTYLSDIVNIVRPLLNAPLMAPSAVHTWSLMSQCADEKLTETGLALSLAMVTLRVMEPACKLPVSWTQENLTGAVNRVIHGLFRLCEKSVEKSDVDNYFGYKSSITVPDVCFAFPLIQIVVKEEHAKRLGIKEDVVEEAIRILCKVLEICVIVPDQEIAIAGDENDDALIGLDENNPSFLPLGDVLETLIEVGEKGKNRLEGDACAAIGNLVKATVKVASSGVEVDERIITQLLGLLLSSKISIRIAGIQGLITLIKQLESLVPASKLRSLLEERIVIAAHDAEDPKVAEFAEELCRDLNVAPTYMLLEAVLQDVSFNKEFVRNSAAAAVGKLLPHFADQTEKVLDRLIKQYSKNIEDCKPKLDKYGRPVSELQIESWPARRGIASTLVRIAPCLNSEALLRKTLEFLLQNPCALKDEKVAVRTDMLQVGITLVNVHGKSHVGPLLTKFEEFLATAPKTADYDVVRQSAIVIMGTLAKHLDTKHPKIRPIVHQLLAALSTPSEEVQKAVSGCIAPLVLTMEDDIKSVVPNLLHVLYESDSYAHRRGAAYGLAGVFQGLGIMSLKDYDVMLTIMEGLKDKKVPQRRESSLLAISMLSVGLGKVFEPFSVQAIPFVLQSIGDSSVHVREAAEEASRGAMSQLSGPGVKLVLPALLKGVDEDTWRSKSAAIEMLGDMAFCAPRQLSSCLPTVVPKLIETLGDSHTRVQQSGVSALKKIASVIKNPEVLGLVPIILSALQDPAKKTAGCLKTILQTQFIHVVDAASLALLMPVIRRAIYDRGTENRKLSAQIMASLYTLADHKDLLPYLEGILPGLKNCLLDPAPEVRLCAAKAIAALVKGTGEAGFEQLKEWLFAKLVSENNSVDRSGAAQGLAESIGILGIEKLQAMMPQFLQVILSERSTSYVRDGYLLVLVYLPVVFGQLFSPFIGDIIPALLMGLSDDTEYVRETALQCGQRIVTYFADSAIELLLPRLENGMFDDNWRIRYASVQLLGDLLYKISGASGKHTTAGLEEDENFGTEQSHLAILHRLGERHRNRVLAGLYISRSDNGLVVRQAALHVWKVIVTNTPKTLREILPELFEILLDALASDNEERRQVAAKTLGELVRKLGERILPDIIPILQDGLNSAADEHREGVCVGLMEIISSSNRETVVMYCDILEPTLKKALLDPHAGVRRAAAEAFCMLDNVVGHKVMDDILPLLFDKVTDPVEGDNALDGLQQIMARRSRVVLPYLIPRLIAPPVNTKTLALLTAVAGEALSKHLNKVLPALLASLQDKAGTPEEEQELSYCRSVMLSVDDENGVVILVDTLMQGVQQEKTRLAAVTLLDLFFANTKVDVKGYFITTIRPLFRLYSFDDPILIKKAASIFNTLIKKTPTDVVYDNVAALRMAIRAVHMELRVPCIPGLCLPEGAQVFIPMLRDALQSVPAEEKEVVGQTITDLVRYSNQAGLKGSVVTITGPIIRVLGDRYGPSVRASMLDALIVLIEKCAMSIKPFAPQIQTTVSRAFSDPARNVRMKAGAIAANIAPMHPRFETMANDLLEVAKTNADMATKETALRSLRQLLGTSGQKLSSQYRSDVATVASRYLDAEENYLQKATAGCLGSICCFAVDEELGSLLKQIYEVPTSDWTLQHGHCLALGAALRDSAEKLVSEKYADTTMEVLLKHQSSDRAPVVVTSTRGIGLFLLHQRKTDQALNKKLLIVLAKSFNHPAIEVKQMVAQICSHLAFAADQPIDASEMKILVPQIVNGTKEKNTAVRYDSEMALADILLIRKDDSVFEACKAVLDTGARESLQNARKSLSKSVLQSETKLSELDETMLVA